MALLYLIRHGQASFGEKNYDLLSDTGIEQSRALGDFFLQSDIKFDSVYSGSMERQIDTAKYSLKEKGLFDGDININEGLNEYDHMALLNIAIPYFKENFSDFPEDLSKLASDRKKFQFFFSIMVEKWIEGVFSDSGLLSYEEYSKQVISSLENIIINENSKKKVALFTSGGVISVVCGYALGLSPFQAVQIGWGINNCSISSFMSGQNKEGNMKLNLKVFNSIAHLEIKNKKEFITYR